MGKPKPFQRPGLSLSSDEPAREWKWVRWDLVGVGDLVAGRGKVTEADIQKGAMGVTFASGVFTIEATSEAVYAFTATPSCAARPFGESPMSKGRCVAMAHHADEHEDASGRRWT